MQHFKEDRTLVSQLRNEQKLLAISFSRAVISSISIFAASSSSLSSYSSFSIYFVL